MISPTKHFKELKKSLLDVRSILSHVPEHLCETRLQHLKVQSYIMLSHAAFEQYVEELVRAAVLEAIRLLNEDGLIT